MNLKQAQQLAQRNGCKTELSPSGETLTIINETINMQWTIHVQDLQDASDDAFISTCTTGHVKRGQRPLPGMYGDYKRKTLGWKVELKHTIKIKK